MSDSDETIIKRSPKKIKNTFQLEERGVLIILSGKELGKTCLIDCPRIIVGRDPSCDLVLEDEGVSKVHFKIRAEEGYFFIEDMGSSNGTYLEGKKIKKKSLLSDFERIVVGKTILRFFMEESL
jgi:pSer/pThr/pTyr-binding forkhead associated (FHA) protein